ncbi:flavin reductase family protein [Solirubrobacter phytolaccae]|uniref:Flavin reductase family protein n=1 Tax=Solirubrobacter phytolaccae TaxID=1404360 RepID=A0A9X3NFN5_9ACTN|nr:flavin reductase family protein [Solirubrobacter phytolaccae]MDA0184140.1 flavin reductase family protein [Solirubrobacter phytolaccae]
MQPLPADALRAAMGHFATGVTVVTAGPGRDPHGSTVNAITSVSLAPPLLLICLREDSLTLGALLTAGHFGVNVLREHQTSIAKRFARRGASWDGVTYSQGIVGGVPVIDGALATLECAVHDVADGGDHRIIVGQVLAVEHPEEHVSPLLFYRGTFTKLGA